MPESNSGEMMLKIIFVYNRRRVFSCLKYVIHLYHASFIPSSILYAYFLFNYDRFYLILAFIYTRFAKKDFL